MKAPLRAQASEGPSHKRDSDPSHFDRSPGTKRWDKTFVDARAVVLERHAFQKAISNSPRVSRHNASADLIDNSARVLQRRREVTTIQAGVRMPAQRQQAGLSGSEKQRDVDAAPGRAVGLQALGAHPRVRQLVPDATAHIAPLRERSTNGTGLPERLKFGIEALSGLSMDHVRVHYESAQPARLHAHAYAQGTDIHLGPGQEKHLPHEAWHLVQQAQGRVSATRQLKGESVNDDASLEREADQMGQLATWHQPGYDHAVPCGEISPRGTTSARATLAPSARTTPSTVPIQRVVILNNVTYDHANVGGLKTLLEEHAETSKRDAAEIARDIKNMTEQANELGTTYRYTGFGPYALKSVEPHEIGGKVSATSTSSTAPGHLRSPVSPELDDDSDDDGNFRPAPGSTVDWPQDYPASMPAAYWTRRRDSSAERLQPAYGRYASESSPYAVDVTRHHLAHDTGERKDKIDPGSASNAYSVPPPSPAHGALGDSDVTNAFASSSVFDSNVGSGLLLMSQSMAVALAEAMTSQGNEQEDSQATSSAQTRNPDTRPKHWGDYDESNARTDNTQRFGIEIELKSTKIPYGGKDSSFYAFAVEYGHEGIKRHNGLELHLDHGDDRNAILEIVLSPGLRADQFIAKLVEIKAMLGKKADSTWLTSYFGQWDINDVHQNYILKNLKGNTTIKGIPVQVTTTHTAQELKNVIGKTKELYRTVSHDKANINLRDSAENLSDNFIVNEYLARITPLNKRKNEGKGSSTMIKHAAEQFAIYGGTRPPSDTEVGRIRMDTPHLNALHTHANKPAPVFKRNDEIAYVFEYRSGSDLSSKAMDFLSGKLDENQFAEFLNRYHT